MTFKSLGPVVILVPYRFSASLLKKDGMPGKTPDEYYGARSIFPFIICTTSRTCCIKTSPQCRCTMSNRLRLTRFWSNCYNSCMQISNWCRMYFSRTAEFTSCDHFEPLHHNFSVAFSCRCMEILPPHLATDVIPYEQYVFILTIHSWIIKKMTSFGSLPRLTRLVLSKSRLSL